MKKLFPFLFVAALGFTGCDKKNSTVDAAPQAAAPLSAGFKLDNSADAKEGTPIQFRNTSVSGSVYKWDFGNGNTSTDKNPVFTYPACGIYTVKLFVTDASGNATSASQELIVDCIFRAPGQPPVVHAPLF